MRAAFDAGSGGETDGVTTFAPYFPQVVAIHKRDIRATQSRLAQQQRLGVLRLRERYRRERNKKYGESEHSLLHRAVSWRKSLRCVWMIRQRGQNRFNGD